MDIAAMNACLDAAYGTSRAAHCPAFHELALYFGNPKDGGVELEEIGGYTRVTISAADWEPAEDGQKELTNWVTYPATTDEWSSSATHWALIDEDDVMWDSGTFAEPIDVIAAGNGPLVQIKVAFADSYTANEG